MVEILNKWAGMTLRLKPDFKLEEKGKTNTISGA
jgi:hypothetical protein